MKLCNNCKREYEDHLNFCSKCGTILIVKPQEYVCPSCGKLLGEKFDRFCPFCGCQFGQVQTSQANQQMVNVVANQYGETNYQQFTNPTAKKKKSWFSKEYLFSFKGRRGRCEAFVVAAINGVLGIGLLVGVAKAESLIANLLIVLIGIILMVVELSNLVKRVHDFNKSGLWLMMCYIGLIVTSIPLHLISTEAQHLYCMFAPKIIFLIKGTNGSNKYGECE